MISTTDFLYAHFATSLCGSILFILWCLAFGVAGIRRLTGASYYLLHIICFFYLIPVVWCILFLISQFYDVWKGRLFVETPVVSKFVISFLGIWLFGVFVAAIVFLIQLIFFRRWLKDAGVINDQEQEIFQSVCKEMKISSKRIRVRKKMNILSPAIAGIFRPVILLPDRNFTDFQLRVIFCHELTHFKQKNLWIKMICEIVQIIHFYNPLIYLLRKVLADWSEYYCDAEASKMCESANDYYGAIMEIVGVVDHEKKETSKIMTPMSSNNLIRRVEYFRMNKGKNNVKKAFVAGVLAFVFCITTVLSVTTFTAYAYTGLFEMSKEESEEKKEPKELVEYVELSREGFSTASEMEIVPRAEGAYSFNWDLSDGAIGKTSQFYAKNGGDIAITVFITPADAEVKVGIVEPSGTMRFVRGTDYISHRFVLDETGLYRVYVDNLTTNNVQINVNGMYMVVNP